MANANLLAAKKAKQDEFYTQWADIEREINTYLEYDPDLFRDKTILLPCDDPEWSNFTKFFAFHFTDFGLKKLISTSYTHMSRAKGRVVTLSGDGTIDINALHWEYLDGDGDFRGAEVTALRDEADIVITNPPFSLFRDFVPWLIEGKLRFAVIGNMNAITYSKIFPLIQNNQMCVGAMPFNTRMDFRVPDGQYKQFNNICWFTNIDYGRRPEPLRLMTMDDNVKSSSHKKVRDNGYQQYDNYDAIEVPFVDAIPSDYFGVMGVPITFLGKHNPNQFEILGATKSGCHDAVPDTRKYNDYLEMRPDGTPTGSSGSSANGNPNLLGNDGRKNYFINDEGRVIQSVYQRLFIRRHLFRI